MRKLSYSGKDAWRHCEAGAREVIQTEAIFDRDHDRYVLINVGWDHGWFLTVGTSHSIGQGQAARTLPIGDVKLHYRIPVPGQGGVARGAGVVRSWPADCSDSFGRVEIVSERLHLFSV